MKILRSALSGPILEGFKSSADSYLRSRRGDWDALAKQWNGESGLLTKTLSNHYRGLDRRWREAAFEKKVKVGEHIFKTYHQIAQRLLGAELKVIELKNGPVSYWSTYKAGRETVLFLHGFGDTKEGAYPLGFFLNKRFNVIALDLPGFGDSFRRPDLSHDLESYARWLEEFLDAIAVDPVHVVGNSLGGAMAIKLTLARPDKVKSMTLLNSAGVVDLEHRSIYDDLLEGKRPFAIQSLEDFDAFLLNVFHKPPLIPPCIKEYVYHRMMQNTDWLEHLVKQNFGGFTERDSPEYRELFMNEQLHKVDVPTLIIWGDNDRVLPVAYGKLTHRLLNNARFFLLKDVGHAPQVEVPSRVAALMNEFILDLQTVSN